MPQFVYIHVCGYLTIQLLDHHHQILQLLMNTFPQAGENCIYGLSGILTIKKALILLMIYGSKTDLERAGIEGESWNLLHGYTPIPPSPFEIEILWDCFYEFWPNNTQRIYSFNLSEHATYTYLQHVFNNFILYPHYENIARVYMIMYVKDHRCSPCL